MQRKDVFKVVGLIALFVWVALVTTCSITKSMREEPTMDLSEIVTPTIEPSPTATPTIERITHVPYLYLDMGIPPTADGRKKTYMDWKTISLTTSPQWRLQQLSTTDDLGFRRFQGKYMIALGSFYAHRIGDEYLIEIDNGTVIMAVLGDYKQDRHTDPTNRYIQHNQNIVEFIVDKEVMDPEVLRSGDVANADPKLKGRVVSIKRVIVYP